MNCVAGSCAGISSNRVVDFELQLCWYTESQKEHRVCSDEIYSFDVFALQRISLRDQIVAGWRIEATDTVLVAIGADERAILIDRQQLFVQILARTHFVMTLRAGRNGNVRFQTSKRRGFSDVDVARCAFVDVMFLFTAAFVNEPGRDALRRIGQHVRCFREFVTTVAVGSYRFL